MTKLKLARLEGQSVDYKPLKYAGGDTPVGAEYTNLDDGRRYKFDGLKWNELSRLEETKNFFSKQPRSSIIRLFGDEFGFLESDCIFLLEDLKDSSRSGASGTGLTNVGEVDFNRTEDKLPLRGYKVPTFGTSQRLIIDTEAKVEVGTNSFIAKIDFKKSSSGATSVLFFYGDEAASEQVWSMRFNPTNELRCRIDDGTNAVSTQDTVPLRWQDGEWHTGLMMVDRTNDILYLFCDGILLSSTSISTVTGTLNNAGTDLGIGAKPVGGQEFNGELSNFQLYQDADPKNLFPLIPILSNPQVREQTRWRDAVGHVLDVATGQRTGSQLQINGTPLDGEYVSTVINVSEGYYDIDWLGQTANNLGIWAVEIDNVEVMKEDWYTSSTVTNVVKGVKNVFISGGTHILKLMPRGKHPSSANPRLRLSMLSLIKRDGEYNESDEATSGILFGDELQQKQTGTWSENLSTLRVFNQSLDLNPATVAGDFTEGTIYIKKGLYKITYTHTTAASQGILDLWMGGVKVIDGYDAYSGSTVNNVQINRFAFLEGGKTTIKLQTNSKNASASEYRITMSSLRFELVDGKGNGDKVNIWGADDDFESVKGANPAISIDTGQRFNHRLRIGFASDALNDEWLNRRYFSGGTYLVKFTYFKTNEGGLCDIGLDAGRANDIFNNVDMYNASNLNNQEIFTVVNISRGFHDIHISNDSAGTGSGFVQNITNLEFTKIGENPDAENDDNSDGVHGSIVPLGRFEVREANDTTVDIILAPIDLEVKYSKVLFSFTSSRPNGGADTVIRFNNTSGTGYHSNGVKNDDTATLVAQITSGVGNINLIPNGIAAADVEEFGTGEIMLSGDGADRQLAMVFKGGALATGTNDIAGFNDALTTPLTQLTFISNVGSGFVAGTKFYVYGVLA